MQRRDGPEPRAWEPVLPFALPDITEEEIDAVVAVLRSRWLTTGARTREFEERFAAAVQAPYAVALNSCTAALHLSLEALGVRPGHLVYLSPYTFAATAEVVRHVGAQPVFVDVDPVTSNIDVHHLRRLVEATGDGRPAAVLPVHLAGVPCDMAEIWDIAREHRLAVVEDAAHAFPSAYRGRPIGWMPPDVEGTTCFSFYATKPITTGEGGMLTTHSERVAERVRLMSLHGLSSQAWHRYAGGGWRYDIVSAGFKYNLSDIAAALGSVQLSRADSMARRRSEIAGRYADAFAPLPALVVPTVPTDRVSSWHLFVLRLRHPLGEQDRDRFVDRLSTRGIGVSVHFIPLHVHSYWREAADLRPDHFPVAVDGYRRSLSLPIYSAMSDADVDRVVAEVVAIAAELR